VARRVSSTQFVPQCAPPSPKTTFEPFARTLAAIQGDAKVLP
jgi:hypothetical protein